MSSAAATTKPAGAARFAASTLSAVGSSGCTEMMHCDEHHIQDLVLRG